MANWNPNLEALEDLKRFERPYPVRLLDAAAFIAAVIAGVLGGWLILVIAFGEFA